MKVKVVLIVAILLYAMVLLGSGCSLFFPPKKIGECNVPPTDLYDGYTLFLCTSDTVQTDRAVCVYMNEANEYIVITTEGCDAWIEIERGRL